jgi:transcriptional regulator with XRE-family HTH domain
MAPRTTAKVFNGAEARRLRETKDLTVKQLVKLIEAHSHLRYHPDTLRNVELGHTLPSTTLSLAWAAALNVPRAELLMDAPEPRTP